MKSIESSRFRCYKVSKLFEGNSNFKNYIAKLNNPKKSSEATLTKAKFGQEKKLEVNSETVGQNEKIFFCFKEYYIGLITAVYHCM